MDNKITNKIVELNDIIQIAEIMQRRCKYYIDLEQNELRKKEEAKINDGFYFTKNIHGNVKYSIQFNKNETVSKDNELEWFKETLINNAKIISEITIYFSGTEEEKREHLAITFTPNRINFDTSSTNMYDNSLANMVEAHINKLKPRYDTIVDKDARRKVVPALNISIILGMIISFALLIITKLDVLSGGVAKLLSNGIVLTSIFLLVAFFGALLIPTKNSELYKNFKFETYYAGFDDKNFKAIRKNDYEEYKSKCEVSIGPNVHMPKVREDIENNYNKAKKLVKIELLVSVVAIVLFFLL